jgi:hypothetical protein
MFRRRTDHVYATLQQVQRRITEQGGGGPPPALTPPPAVRAMPSPATTPLGSPVIPDRPIGSDLPPPPPPMSAAPHLDGPLAPSVVGGAATVLAPRRRGVLLPPGLVITLGVCWIATFILGVILGMYLGTGERGEHGMAPGGPGERLPITSGRDPQPRERETPAAIRPGNALLKLAAGRRQDEAKFVEAAQKYNAQYRQAGRPQLWGVYRPTNGELVLAYGQLDGEWGIDPRSPEAQKVFEEVRRSPGAAGAAWLTIK